MTHRHGFPRLSAKGAWCGDARHRKHCGTPSAPWPKALGSRRSGRAGEPAAGESVGASESLDDVPHRPRLPSYPPVGPTHRPPVGPPVGPTHRLRDLYGSLSALLGIRLTRTQLAEAIQ